MPEYTNNDINDARRRVEEMRRRARNYVNENNNNNNNTERNHTKKNNSPPKQSIADNSSQKSGGFDLGFVGDIISSLISNGNESDNSTPLLLALILILTREGADNKLILALLYILL